jgi:RNAse (barnase) inhibitor barstar
LTPAQKDPFAALPSHCVRPLAPLTADQLARWASASGQHYVEVDLEAATSKKAVLTAIGRALGFPAWYGANLDALYDCLTDLPEREDIRAWLIVLRHLPPTGALDAEQHAALLDVFRDATEAFADAGVGLRVFHAP